MKLCILEPYYGGSHRTLVDMLSARYEGADVFTMRAKKWHWRLRTAALTYSQIIPQATANYDVLFVSSMVNLADLLALRMDLRLVPNIILYFHENQLEYPKQQEDAGERDHYFAHANIMSCLVATQVLFNSQFNMESFLGKIPAFFNKLPMEQACRPDGLRVCEEIRKKSKVVFMLVQHVTLPRETAEQHRRFTIGFPHRWEHDKDPQMFIRVLQRLRDSGGKRTFAVRVFGGEEYEAVSIRKDLQGLLLDEAANSASAVALEQCGRLESREDYLNSLAQCDVVVSTAVHEFFGVSMLEAALLGCHVLCPNRLAYPEIFQRRVLYNTEAQLFKALQSRCVAPRTRAALAEQLLPGVQTRIDLDGAGGQAFDECIFQHTVVGMTTSTSKRTRNEGEQ